MSSNFPDLPNFASKTPSDFPGTVTPADNPGMTFTVQPKNDSSRKNANNSNAGKADDVGPLTQIVNIITGAVMQVAAIMNSEQKKDTYKFTPTKTNTPTFSNFSPNDK